MISLDTLPQRTVARVHSICDSVVSNRLMEMGFYPDQKLEILGKAPFGDPLAVRIGNSTVMLRLTEAQCVSVVEENR